MAEVGAIGQVVGAQSPQQQLQQVGGLVGGAARAIGGQPLRRHFEGLLGELKDVVPADRLVVAAALPQDQRLAQSPQPVGLQGAELLQLVDAALAEQSLGHGGLQFGRDRFHTFEAALQGLPQLIIEATVLAEPSITGQPPPTVGVPGSAAESPGMGLSGAFLAIIATRNGGNLTSSRCIGRAASYSDPGAYLSPGTRTPTSR